ncbi:MAG: putative Histidine kinase [Gemmatimonadetes bacterium]|nr:putative Histidine kinase [Gemmatimonadota bacterium]
MPNTAIRLSERLERLVQGVRDLTVEPALDRVLQGVVDLAREIIGARYAAIGLLASDRQKIETFVTAGLPPEQRARMGPIPQGHGILGLVIRQTEPIRLADLGAHPESAGFPPNHPRMRSFLGVPVVGRHGVLGNLYLTEKQGEAEFTGADEHLAVLLAGMAAAAVENARHHEESARLLSEVQTLLRSRERFFAMVNHELRNSLAAVYGWAEMLVRRKDPATVPKAAFEVLESAESSVALINDLLDLSRLDEDRLKPVLKDVHCHEVTHRAIAKVTPSATARGVHLKVVEGDVLPACHTDPHRVEQILVNLLTNAIRHTRDGSTVEIRVEQAPGELRLSVSDEGQGIATDLLDRVFDVYYTKPGEEGRGMGLGLPLSRRLARALGGDLEAGNRPTGGAVFTLRLPLSS